jgi:hypothetical protein
MKPIIYLVPVFIDEFQSLHDSGYISVDRSRIVVVSAEKGGLSRPEVLCQVAATLPDFMPDAELSVVIACFTCVPCEASLLNSREPLEASKAVFMAKECSGVIPLTERSREILNGRFNGQVTLMEPVFEGLIEERFTQRDLRNKIQGGDALVEVLVANYDSGDFSRLRSIVTANGEAVTLVQKTLGYTRHAPAALEPISGLRDLRKILRDTLSDPKHLNPPLAKLSAWGDPKWETISGFRKVYGDLELIKSLDLIDDYWKLPVSAVSLGIFLHWRELSLRVQGVDLKALQPDCRELAGVLDARFVLEAIWLLGFSAGFSSFAGSYYASLETPHPFGAKRQTVKRTTLLRLERVPDPKLTPPADDETTHARNSKEVATAAKPPITEETPSSDASSVSPEGVSEPELAAVAATELNALDESRESQEVDREKGEDQPAIQNEEDKAVGSGLEEHMAPAPAEIKAVEVELITVAPQKQKTASKGKPRAKKSVTSAKKEEKSTDDGKSVNSEKVESSPSVGLFQTKPDDVP